MRVQCARAALRLVGLVEVLETGFYETAGDLRTKLVRELALLVDGLQDRVLTLLELRVVLDAVLDLPDLHFVEIAVRLLAVTGNERNRTPFGKKSVDCADLSGPDADLRGNPGYHH